MPFWKPLKLIVEYQSNDYTKSLEKDIERLRTENRALDIRVHELSLKYGYETQVNNELIDTLREHGVYFRPSANLHKNREDT